MSSIHIKYRVDKRIKVVEITTGSKKFLVGLMDFVDETNIRNFEESITGETYIDGESYKTLWGDRIQ